jgi:hypothetical protein
MSGAPNPQHDKIRLVLNLCAPAGASYNDFLDKSSLPRAPMSSVRRFSHSLWRAGPQFDTSAASLQNLTLLQCPIPSYFLHRQLSDLPTIGPANFSLCHNFYTAYHSICTKLNVKLAPPCPDHDKAFSPTSVGTVPGKKKNFNYHRVI